MVKYLDKHPYAEISSQDGLHKLKLCTYQYQFPNITSGPDADWQDNYLLVAIPGMHVEFEESMFEGAYMQKCIDKLTKFSNLELDQVFIEPLEYYFSLDFSFDPMKKVIVQAVVRYPLGKGAKLEFDFVTDLTYIDKFIEGFKNILYKYPCRI